MKMKRVLKKEKKKKQETKELIFLQDKRWEKGRGTTFIRWKKKQRKKFLFIMLMNIVVIVKILSTI